MNRLPLPVATVTVPEMFSPSELYLAGECQLRAVLPLQRPPAYRLPTHPSAERGRLFHLLLELAGKGAIPQGTDLREAAEREFTRLLADAAARLEKDPQTRHFARLEATLPPVVWHNLSQKVITAAAQLLTFAPPSDRSKGSHAAHEALWFEHLGEEGRWTEVRIRAPRLRLAGRMDVVEKEAGGHVVVRDYKTGRLRERDGELRPSIEMQLRLYALAIRELQPDARIDLVAWDGADIPVDTGESALAEAQEFLVHVVEGLPANNVMQAESLAQPGAHCRWCPFRPVCSAYLSAAPASWNAGCSDGPLPLDTWGTVIAVGPDRPDGTRVELRDAAGRMVKIQRIDSRHETESDLGVGDQVWFFGLEGRALMTAGRWRQPRMFHELPPRPDARRSWSLAIFLAPQPSSG
jgi:RecB family exonuclease